MKAKAKPTSDAERMRATLRESGDWLTAAEVAEMIGVSGNDASRQMARMFKADHLERRVGEGSRFEYRIRPGFVAPKNPGRKRKAEGAPAQPASPAAAAPGPDAAAEADLDSEQAAYQDMPVRPQLSTDTGDHARDAAKLLAVFRGSPSCEVGALASLLGWPVDYVRGCVRLMVAAGYVEPVNGLVDVWRWNPGKPANPYEWRQLELPARPASESTHVRAAVDAIWSQLLGLMPRAVAACVDPEVLERLNTASAALTHAAGRLHVRYPEVS